MSSLPGRPKEGSLPLVGQARSAKGAQVAIVPVPAATLVVCGVDEAGRGPLAGPVFAAAVILPRRRRIRGLRDSKKLTPEERDRLALRHARTYRPRLNRSFGTLRPFFSACPRPESDGLLIK